MKLKKLLVVLIVHSARRHLLIFAPWQYWGMAKKPFSVMIVSIRYLKNYTLILRTLISLLKIDDYEHINSDIIKNFY